MNLSHHFTLEEFTMTQQRGIDNDLPIALQQAAQETAEMLERIREFLSATAGRNVPLIITSGYRCPALNAAVGGSATSDHVKAMAADWHAPAFGTPYQICKALAPQIQALGIGQLIHEFGRWVHTSTRVAPVASNRVITISAAGTRLGIQEA